MKEMVKEISTKIMPPANCPSCGSILEWKNDQLFCVSHSCQTKVYKRVEHFAKTLRIKGLGPKTVEKLALKDINEIYLLNYDYTHFCLNSHIMANKLLLEINKSKEADLQTLLPAFSIPLFGRSAAEKLCSKINHINDINHNKCKEAGLGQKVTDNLMEWLTTTQNQYSDLPFTWRTNHPLPKAGQQVNELKGVVCISGKLNTYKTKAIAKKLLEENGYKVKSGLTKDVNILVNESGIESAKTKKARDNNITIINNINELI
jgi:DNA ligase (NAD+)